MTSFKGRLASAAVVLFAWIACGGERGYGEPCTDGGECEEDVCIKGTCAGKECRCGVGISGPCPGDTGCPSGFQCLGAGTGADYAIARCFRECDETRPCPRDHVCNAGVCRYGNEPPAIAWANLPRAVPCRAGGPCLFEVKVVSGPVPDEYRWLVDKDEIPTVTKEPRYEPRLTAGQHTVTVVAVKGSAETRLQAQEDACVGTTGCNADGSIACCAGTCGLDGACH